MKLYCKFLIIISLCHCFQTTINSQVHIGFSGVLHNNAALDLNSQNNYGLLLDSSSTVPDILTPSTEGLLKYYNGYLYISQNSSVAQWNVLSPWIFTGDVTKGVSYPNKGASGVGIGVNTFASGYSYPTNLHLGQSGREVVETSSLNSAMLIGDVSTTSTYNYLLFDNDEILAKTKNGTADTLNLQKMANADVQIGLSGTTNSELNVYGKVKEGGGQIQPTNTIIMWTGNVGDVTKFTANGLGIGDMTGWAVCNGNNSTPNLQGQFIVGYGTRNGYTFTQKAFAGSDEVMQRTDEVGAHQHTSGTLVTSSIGNHSHLHYVSSGDDNVNSGLSNGSDDGVGLTGYNYTTTTDGAHTHTLAGTTATNGYSTSQQAIPNIPAYYVVVYLKKLF